MKPTRPVPLTVDEYIQGFSPAVQAILQQIRQVVRQSAPQAQEVISYKMPAFRQHGILIYFAAFTNHIGLYPPVVGDAGLQQALAPYRGEKGNLRFPLKQPIPFDLIARIVALRVEQDAAKSAASTLKR